MAISDTHTLHEQVEVPDGDLLVHAGDLTNRGALADVVAFNRWLEGLPHRHKVVIAGNHDFCFERDGKRARALITAATYLEDEAVVIEGVRIYGSPWQPFFYDWAFNLRRGQPLRDKWALIPAATDLLITHGPALGHGDRTSDGRAEGCADLLDRIRVVQPRFHVCGHIHEGYGVTREGDTTCVNASICTLQYAPTNPPIVFDIRSLF